MNNISERQDLLIGTIIELSKRRLLCCCINCIVVDGLYLSMEPNQDRTSEIDSYLKLSSKILKEDTHIKPWTQIITETEETSKGYKIQVLEKLQQISSEYRIRRNRGHKDNDLVFFIKKQMSAIGNEMSSESYGVSIRECDIHLANLLNPTVGHS